MEIASVIFEHTFDKAMLDQINTLRTLRLNMAETMLRDLAKTKLELTSRGLADKVDTDELRSELTARIATLRGRLKTPENVYADELDLYIDLIGQDPDGDDAESDSDHDHDIDSDDDHDDV